MCDMSGICQERYDRAAEVPASELLLWDVVLPIPNNGPWGPWEVREVRGAYMSTTRVDIVNATETWYGVPSDRTYRIERLGRPRGFDSCTASHASKTSERI